MFDNASQILREVMRKCLQVDPAARPTAVEVVKARLCCLQCHCLLALPVTTAYDAFYRHAALSEGSPVGAVFALQLICPTSLQLILQKCKSVHSVCFASMASACSA